VAVEVDSSGGMSTSVFKFNRSKEKEVVEAHPEKDEQSGEWPEHEMGARQYSPGYGRFVTPDENLVDQEAADPLSWNLYGYGRNNPLRYSDPTGRKCYDNSDGSIAYNGLGKPYNFSELMGAHGKFVEVEPATMERSHEEWAMGVIREAGRRASDGSAIEEGFKASRDVRDPLRSPIVFLLGAVVHTAPGTLTGFPDARRARNKMPLQGGGGLRRRWKDDDGNICEWDSRHGAVGKYNRRGRRLGEFEPATGQQTKPANSAYRVEP